MTISKITATRKLADIFGEEEVSVFLKEAELQPQLAEDLVHVVRILYDAYGSKETHEIFDALNLKVPHVEDRISHQGLKQLNRFRHELWEYQFSENSPLSLIQMGMHHIVIYPVQTELGRRLLACMVATTWNPRNIDYFDVYSDFRYQRAVKKYALALMSSLDDIAHAEDNVIYLSEDPKAYYVKGMQKKAALPEEVDVTHLETKLGNSDFQQTVFEITSKAGHTQTKLLSLEEARNLDPTVSFIVDHAGYQYSNSDFNRGNSSEELEDLRPIRGGGYHTHIYYHWNFPGLMAMQSILYFVYRFIDENDTETRALFEQEVSHCIQRYSQHIANTLLQLLPEVAYEFD